MRPPLRSIRASIVFAAYLLLALIATWPLARHPRETVPGVVSFAGSPISCDTWTQVWNLWWVSEVLDHPEESLYQTTHLFYPEGTSLAHHTLAPIYGLVAYPVTKTLGPVAAWNVLLWLLLAATGWSTFLLCRYAGAGDGASFLGGAAFAFSPYATAHVAAGHLNLAGLQWLPLYFLAMARALRLRTAAPRGGARALLWPVLAGIVLVATAYASFYYLAFLLLATAFLFFYLLAVRRSAFFRWETILAFALPAAFFLAGVTPLLLAFRSAAAEGAFLPVRGHGVLGADVLSFLLPGFLNTFVGGAVGPAVAGMTRLPQELTLTPGITILALGAWGASVRRAQAGARAFAGLGLLFLVLSLGVYLKVNGASTFTVAGHAFRVPLPYLALSHLPPLADLRAPGRFAVVFLLVLAVLAALGLQDLMERARSRVAGRAIGAGAAALVAFELACVPLPLLCARVPSIYREIAREPGAFALLEVPFGLRDGSWTFGPEESRFQLYQTVHGKPILSGFVSRMQQAIPGAVGREPVLGTLLQADRFGGLNAQALAFDRTYGAAYLRKLGVRYVLVHPWVTSDGPEEVGRGDVERANRYRAVADHLERALAPVARSVTEEGIIVLRLE